MRRRNQLRALAAANESSVCVCDLSDVSAVHDLSASERYGNDIRDGDTCPEVGVGGRPVVTRQSAVLPSVGGDGESLGSGVVDALLGVLSASQSSPVNPPDQRQPQVIPIKRGCSPLIEWYDNAKMLAGAFPELFLIGPGSLPSRPLSRAHIDHFMHYWDGRFEKSTRFLAVLFNQLQRHTAVRNAARVGAARGTTLKSFGKISSTPAFKDALTIAKVQPDSPPSVRLNALLLRMLSLVGLYHFPLSSELLLGPSWEE